MTPASQVERLGLVRTALTEPEAVRLLLRGDVAFLRAEQGVYFARREPWPPLSPVFRLLRGVYELEPKRARFIARRRIFATRPASATCLGATRVAARQLSAPVVPAEATVRDLERLPWIDAGAHAPAPRRATASVEAALAALAAAEPRPRDDEGFLQRAVALTAALRLAARPDGRRDKPVAALLVEGSGGLLGWSTNTGSHNATSHAEVNLVEGWLIREGRLLPAGCRLYSTLKPCKMCAGLVWDSAQDPWSLRVLYAEEDPLRYARETVLDARGMARRRVARSASEVEAVLQQRLFVPGVDP